ncbi:DUF3494 domain-containing protein [Brevibacterium aurantiacum]|uniref:DUF3494 domain-containing protein n=2 Tax=Brevibacterium aurantiacum TaxID=273384 RepID=A0A556CB39_BREAU|nr:DUF3494 domain-containing protein [Brevibacterium aurantiacum]
MWAPTAAAATAVNLATAESYAVLGGSTVTNTGPTILDGDLGVAPGTAITGFPPGTVQDGTIHANDAVAQQAQTDLTTAYDVAAGQPSDFDITADLGGQTLVPGVYTAETAAELTGDLTLDAQNDPSAVWIFQVGSTLTTASASSVSLIGGAQACNVFWQVGSSATLGTNTSFVGTIMALTSASLVTGTTIDGRALARNGAVTLDSNVITAPGCGDDGEDADTNVNAEADSTAEAEADPSADTEVTADATTDDTGAEVTADDNATADTGAEVTADDNATADTSAEVTADDNATADTSAEVTADDTVGATADVTANAGADMDTSTGAQVDADIDVAAGVTAETDVRGELPSTGAQNLWIAPVAVGLLIVGAALMLLIRRRRVEG